jgi:hypothetical protein
MLTLAELVVGLALAEAEAMGLLVPKWLCEALREETRDGLAVGPGLASSFQQLHLSSP